MVLKDFHSVVIEVCEKCLFINAEADFFRLLNLQDFICHVINFNSNQEWLPNVL